jgi:RPE4 domain-containing protein
MPQGRRMKTLPFSRLPVASLSSSAALLPSSRGLTAGSKDPAKPVDPAVKPREDGSKAAGK